jgi:multidrug efflux pump subunit AcrA (membrane-fusion protein)
MKFKKIEIIILVVALALPTSTYFIKKSINAKNVAAVNTNVSKENKEENVELKEVKVQRGNVKIKYSADGQVSLPTRNKDFEIAGTVDKILVKSGDVVKEGDVIATLDSKDYSRDYSEAQFNASSGQTKAQLDILKENQNLSTLKDKYDLAQRTGNTQVYNEKIKLDDLEDDLKDIKDDYMPMVEAPDAYTKEETDAKKKQYETAQDNYNSQLKKYNDLKAQVDSDIQTAKKNYDYANESYSLDVANSNNNATVLNNKLAKAKDSLDKTVLKAPCDGTILHVSKEVGDNVTAGAGLSATASSQSSFVSILPSKNMKVESYVSETEINNIKVGQNVEVRIKAVTPDAILGKVTEINPTPKVDKDNKITYLVESEIEYSNPRVLEDMNVKIDFIYDEKKDVLCVDKKAIKKKDGKAYVEVKGANGKTEEKEIIIGISDDDNVEIISGLNLDDTVIIK